MCPVFHGGCPDIYGLTTQLCKYSHDMYMYRWSGLLIEGDWHFSDGSWSADVAYDYVCVPTGKMM